MNICTAVVLSPSRLPDTIRAVLNFNTNTDSCFLIRLYTHTTRYQESFERHRHLHVQLYKHYAGAVLHYITSSNVCTILENIHQKVNKVTEIESDVRVCLYMESFLVRQVTRSKTRLGSVFTCSHT